METRVVEAMDSESIALAAELLRAGKTVAIPTETVYGLAANALNPAAVARIYEAKGRPAHNPLIVHVADVASAKELTAEWPLEAEALAKVYWPGPLTLVLKRNERVPDIVTAGGPTVALRVPASSIARKVIRASGLPLAAPSANRSNHISPTTAEHVLRGLGGRIELILDGGPCRAGVESTVIRLDGEVPTILRSGPITRAALEGVLGRGVEIYTGRGDESLASPGMLSRHYAPRVPLTLFYSLEELRECIQMGRMVAVSILDSDDDGLVGEIVKGCGGQIVTVVHTGRDSEGVQQALYGLLHELEGSGADQIVWQLPPDSDEWAAIRDRLTRAASK